MSGEPFLMPKPPRTKKGHTRKRGNTQGSFLSVACSSFPPALIISLDLPPSFSFPPRSVSSSFSSSRPSLSGSSVPSSHSLPPFSLGSTEASSPLFGDVQTTGGGGRKGERARDGKRSRDGRDIWERSKGRKRPSTSHKAGPFYCTKYAAEER